MVDFDLKDPPLGFDEANVELNNSSTSHVSTLAPDALTAGSKTLTSEGIGKRRSSKSILQSLSRRQQLMSCSLKRKKRQPLRSMGRAVTLMRGKKTKIRESSEKSTRG